MRRPALGPGPRLSPAPQPLSRAGRAGHAGIVKILENTRFRLDERVDTPKAWVAYWDARADSKRIVPLVCSVCGDVPDKITLSNLVSQTNSSARCSCTSRPRHGTLAGRERVADAVGARGYELVLSADAWVGAHLRRGEAWRFIALRCVACEAERHVVVSRGSSSYTSVRKCPCQIQTHARAAAADPPTKRRRGAAATHARAA